MLQRDEPNRGNKSSAQVRWLESQGNPETNAEHALRLGVRTHHSRKRTKSVVLGVFLGVGQLHVGLWSYSVLVTGKAKGETPARAALVAGANQAWVQSKAQVHQGTHGNEEASAYSHISKAVWRSGGFEAGMWRKGRSWEAGNGESDRRGALEGWRAPES